MVAAGKYTAKDGTEKTRWVAIGVMMQGNNGPYLLLEPHINLAAFKEAGKDRIMVSVFEPKDHASRTADGAIQSKMPTKISTDAPFDDEAPF